MQERIQSVQMSLKSNSWKVYDYYLVTDKESYKIFPSSIGRSAVPSQVKNILPTSFYNELIVEIHSDGEGLAIRLENKSVILLMMEYCPFQELTEFVMYFVLPEEIEKWQVEWLKSTKPICLPK